MLNWLLAIGIAVAAGLLSAGAIYEERRRRRDALRFPALGQMIDVGGHRLHLLTKGTEGPTVVIEQGAGGPSLAWLRLQDEIAQFARVCLYDRAGYQWSDLVSGPRSLESRVQDLYKLLVEARVTGPYVLVGHSYGGFLVRLFTRDYPGSVAGLVLVDTPEEQGYCRREVLSLYSKLTWMLRVMGLLSRCGLPRLVTGWLAKPDPSLPPGVSEQLNSFMVRREYFASAADDLVSLQRASPQLVKPGFFGGLGDLPVAVITHGKPFPGPFAVLETFWREGQDSLARLSTNSLLTVAGKSNHMIQNDEPQMIIAAVRGVVASVRTGRPLNEISQTTGTGSAVAPLPVN